MPVTRFLMDRGSRSQLYLSCRRGEGLSEAASGGRRRAAGAARPRSPPSTAGRWSTLACVLCQDRA